MVYLNWLEVGVVSLIVEVLLSSVWVEVEERVKAVRQMVSVNLQIKVGVKH